MHWSKTKPIRRYYICALLCRIRQVLARGMNYSPLVIGRAFILLLRQLYRCWDQGKVFYFLFFFVLCIFSSG